MFGSKATEVFEKEASTPELRDALIKLAEVSPDKFIAIFKKDVQKGPGVDSSGSKKVDIINVNTSSQEHREAHKPIIRLSENQIPRSIGRQVRNSKCMSLR